MKIEKPSRNYYHYKIEGDDKRGYSPLLHHSYSAVEAPLMKPQWGKCCGKSPRLDPYTNQFHANSVMLLTIRVWEIVYSTQPLLNIHTRLSNLFFGILEIPRFCDQSCCSCGRHYSLG